MDVLVDNEPNNEFAPPSDFELLKTTSLSIFSFDCVVTDLFSFFKSSNVKKLENAPVLKTLLSVSETTLSNAKLLFVNWEVPLVICNPTKLSANVSAPLAASAGFITLAENV